MSIIFNFFSLVFFCYENIYFTKGVPSICHTIICHYLEKSVFIQCFYLIKYLTLHKNELMQSDNQVDNI
jgi:hypothetical protein